MISVDRDSLSAVGEKKITKMTFSLANSTGGEQNYQCCVFESS